MRLLAKVRRNHSCAHRTAKAHVLSLKRLLVVADVIAALSAAAAATLLHQAPPAGATALPPLPPAANPTVEAPTPLEGAGRQLPPVAEDPPHRPELGRQPPPAVVGHLRPPEGAYPLPQEGDCLPRLERDRGPAPLEGGRPVGRRPLEMVRPLALSGQSHQTVWLGTSPQKSHRSGHLGEKMLPSEMRTSCFCLWTQWEHQRFHVGGVEWGENA
jgi:hypothetical protein